jgi:hypothetical protein
MSTNPSTPTAAGGALSSPAQVTELADQLSACADRLHERVMRDIRAYHGAPVPDAAQAAARALLDDELVLRQRANGLYADAASYIVHALGASQIHLITLTKDAAEKIKNIVHIGDAISLSARLLGLAAAAATGQPAPIMLALEYLHHQLDLMTLENAAMNPAPPAPQA